MSLETNLKILESNRESKSKKTAEVETPTLKSNDQTYGNNELRENQRNLLSTNIELSYSAAKNLAQIGFPSINILSSALTNKNTHVAVHAAWALGMIGSNAKSSIFNLIWLLHRKNKEARVSAAIALGRIRSIPRVSIQALSNALLDKEVVVRQYASAALGEFSGDDLSYVIEDLRSAAKDDDLYVREFVNLALSKI